MKPIDFRNATFEQVQLRIEGQRAAVMRAWHAHGPGTTKQLAEASGLSILTLRPRTTELVELGFVVLAEAQPVKGEGTYRVRTTAEHLAWLNEQARAARNPQRELALGG